MRLNHIFCLVYNKKMRFQIMREQCNKYQLISKIMQISISLLITRKQVYPSFF
ncbi:hypothetical protein pb186bvf_019121 [Paramecium bursaria]